MTDIYRHENLPSEVDGIVKEQILYKGGNLTLILQTKHNKDSAIAIGPELGKIIKKGDRFIKFANSNKCLLERNDSIMYADCFNIPSDLRDSLGVIEEWPKDWKNHWKKKQKVHD